MRNKMKLNLFAILIICSLTIIGIYNNKTKISKLQLKKGLAIMVKEDGSSNYVNSNSIPKGDYVLNEEKTICENGGKVSNYDSATGQVAFNFLGSDRCSLYFDYKQTPGYLKIINNNGGINAIKAKGTPDLTVLPNSNEGMYVTKDDLGDSYYFRGLTDNNWLQYGEYTKDYIVYRGYNSDNNFADFLTLNDCQNDEGDNPYNINCAPITIAKKGDKIYWKIVRINGDNTIRLIYNGTTQPTEINKINFGYLSTLKPGSTVVEDITTYIATSYYNKGDGAEYVGYQYIEGEQHGYGSNAVDSIAKKLIDNWFIFTSLQNNSNISDQIYCNDRSSDSLTEDFTSDVSIDYNGYTRINNDSGVPNPTLLCTNNADKFTVNTNIGNGALSYPIGLLTIDEFIFAGAHTNLNNCYPGNYLGFSSYNTSIIGTPLMAGNSYPGIYDTSDGCWNYASINDSSYGINPVISLSSDVILTGDGTWNNPYKVVS